MSELGFLLGSLPSEYYYYTGHPSELTHLLNKNGDSTAQPGLKKTLGEYRKPLLWVNYVPVSELSPSFALYHFILK